MLSYILHRMLIIIKHRLLLASMCVGAAAGKRTCGERDRDGDIGSTPEAGLMNESRI
jgi:hypothetical protein